MPVLWWPSADGGKSWGKPATVIEDPEGRIFYWDLRTAVAPDGRLIAFSWTYDRKINKYLNISRLIGDDGGRSWSPPEDLGFADQPAHPAILPDGHAVLAWVNRFGNQTIRAGIAPGIDQPFIAEKELVLYHHNSSYGRYASYVCDWRRSKAYKGASFNGTFKGSCW